MSTEKTGIRLVKIPSSVVFNSTLNSAVARSFQGGVPQANTRLTHIIFTIQPKPEHVIVNLDFLLQDPGYIKALDDYRSEIVHFETGTGKHWNSQSEVILNVGVANDDDIWTFGGWSSSFDELVGHAYASFFGRKASHSEFAIFRKQVEQLSEEGGARWMTPESAERVIARVRPKAEVLVKLKAAPESL